MVGGKRLGRVLLAMLFATAGCASPEKHVGVGDLLEVDAAAQQVTLRHEAIAGVAAAGTGRFALSDASTAAQIEPGARVRFELVRRTGGLTVVRLDALAQGNPGLHDHTPHHGGIVGMAGMIHLEARAEQGGRVQLYLTDRWRKPLPLEGVRGSLKLRFPDGVIDLALAAGREALEARAPPIPGREVSAHVQLVRDGVPIDMHFLLPLQPQGKGAVGVPEEGCVARLGRRGAGRQPRCTMTFQRPVAALAASRDGSTMLIALADLGVSAWDTATGRLLRGLAAPPPIAVPAEEAPHVEAANAVVFRPDGREAAVALENRVIRYALDSGEVVGALDGRGGVVRDVAWSPDGERLLLTTFYHRAAQLIDARDGRPVEVFMVEREAAAVAFAPAGSVVAVGSETGSITLFQTSSGRRSRSFRPSRALTRGLVFVGDLLLAAGDDGVLRIWDASSGSPVYESVPAQPVHHLSVAEGGRLVATGGLGGTIRLHDLERREVVETLARSEAQITGLAWAARTLVSADAAGEVAIWDLSDRLSP